jgi:hypothetical protein
MKIAEGASRPRPIADLVSGVEAGKFAFVIALGSDLDVDAAAVKPLRRL